MNQLQQIIENEAERIQMELSQPKPCKKKISHHFYVMWAHISQLPAPPEK